MHEDLLSLIIGDASTAALIVGRASWGLIPQASPDPAIALFEISTAPNYTMQGQDNLVPTTVQVDCRGRSFREAMTVARAVRARLKDFKGVHGATHFDGIFQRGGRVRSEKPENVVYHTVSTDFEVWSRPAS